MKFAAEVVVTLLVGEKAVFAIIQISKKNGFNEPGPLRTLA